MVSLLQHYETCERKAPMQTQLFGFRSQQTFGKSSLQSDEPGTQRESGWLHPYSILEATAKGDKIISAWRSSHDIDKLCREQ